MVAVGITARARRAGALAAPALARAHAAAPPRRRPAQAGRRSSRLVADRLAGACSSRGSLLDVGPATSRRAHEPYAEGAGRPAPGAILGQGAHGDQRPGRQPERPLVRDQRPAGGRDGLRPDAGRQQQLPDLRPEHRSGGRRRAHVNPDAPSYAAWRSVTSINGEARFPTAPASRSTAIWTTGADQSQRYACGYGVRYARTCRRPSTIRRPLLDLPAAVRADLRRRCADHGRSTIGFTSRATRSARRTG